MPERIVVPIPRIRSPDIGRRMYYNKHESDDPTGEVWGYVPYRFFPPDSLSDWPKTIGDIGNETMQRLLGRAKNGAVGILCDGVVYTDDCLFWLSKNTPQSKPQFVYQRGKDREWVERQRFCSFVPWSYIDEHPRFARPESDTPIIFEGLGDWERLKQTMPYDYGKEGVKRRNAPPPPYPPAPPPDHPPPPYEP